ncbi:MAG: DUF2207 domain-containing protein [Aerococcaceae bacterium]|nr:DUF2207 domain-containing protein [Aerococcaceae bacterium]
MKRLCTVMSLLWLLLPYTVMAQEVEFDITRQEVVTEIQASGNVKFTDKQFYDVTFMNGAFFKLDHRGYELQSYRVGIVNETTGAVDYLTEAYDGSARTFQVNTQGEQTTFKVYYPSEEEYVTFVYEYTLQGMVINYQDTAVFERKLVGEATNDFFDVEAKVILPGEVVVQEDLRAWGYGVPQGEVTLLVENGKSVVQLTAPNNPPHQSVAVHMLFPTSMTPNNPNVVAEMHKDAMIEREAGIVEEDAKRLAQKQQRYQLQGLGSVLLLLLMPFGAIAYYFTQRRKLNPNPKQYPHHIYSLPADITPAVMACAALRHKPNAADFSATIVDLARKGYLELEEVFKEKRGFFGQSNGKTVLIKVPDSKPNLSELQKHEYAVWEYVTFDTPITLETLTERAQEDSTIARRQEILWEKFENNASLKGEQLSQPAFYTRIFSRVLLGAAFFINIVLTLFALVFLKMSGLNWAINGVVGLAVVIQIVLLVVFLLSIFKPIVSAKEYELRQEWLGFANMLRDIGQLNMREIGSLELWDEYLVYAISLGVADKVIEAMNVQFTQGELDAWAQGRHYYYSPNFYTHTMNHSVASSLSASMPKVDYSGNNRGGFGGGFSGGSSGSSGGGSGSGGF